MAELIAMATLFIGLLGTMLILFRKIPVLAQLPNSSAHNPLFFRIKSLIGRCPGIKNFSYELFLQKSLSKTRILILKTENKITGLLEKTRQKSNQKNNSNFGRSNDGYWEELRKIKNKK